MIQLILPLWLFDSVQFYPQNLFYFFKDEEWWLMVFFHHLYNPYLTARSQHMLPFYLEKKVLKI